MQSECACFHLNTTDIGSNVNIYNQYGSINTNRNDITWNNVSLRIMMGPMYDKYDKLSAL